MAKGDHKRKYMREYHRKWYAANRESQCQLKRKKYAEAVDADYVPRQCARLGCTNMARKNSIYCSNNCRHYASQGHERMQEELTAEDRRRFCSGHYKAADILHATPEKAARMLTRIFSGEAHYVG